MIWATVLAIAVAAPQGAPVPIQVDADEVHYEYREHKVLFVGKPLVRLTREDAVLTCRKLVAENDDQGRLERAVCTGDVRLVRGDRVVTCEKATYEERSARVVCRGNPELRDGKSVMRGDELVYDLAEDRATLSSAKGTVVPKPGEDPVQAKKKKEAQK
ncbi:MAG TPA: LptA/OstA family protein [Anaeromyxobacteraceae bacterium]|nr:LptA/OstA family protein [Anaeromyxobacteraceae bacterium]